LIYLGHLQFSDPLYGFLHDQIFGNALNTQADSGFRVFGLTGSNSVYIYEDRRSRLRVIGKFFDRKSQGKNEDSVRHEYQILTALKDKGFDHGRHKVVRPLGMNIEIGAALFEGYDSGEPLHAIWGRTNPGCNDQEMYHSLSDLAYFLSRLHNYNTREQQVEFPRVFQYFDKVVARLWRRHRISQGEIDLLYNLRNQWSQEGAMYEDIQVLLHGDATPANFLMRGHHQLTAIDFERAHYGDRAYDLGMVTGELQHWALRQHHDFWIAEPYIGHFLWEYCRHFPDQSSAFYSITRRIPFYQGLTLLRIARNSYLTESYARSLIHQSIACLRR